MDDEQLRADISRSLVRFIAGAVLNNQVVTARLGLGPSDSQFMSLLNLHGPLTPGRFAELSGLTTGTVTGVIDRLERAGFARRERDAADRRKVLVRALPAVERRIAPLYAPMQRAGAASLAPYSEQELALLLGFLERAYRAAVAATAELRDMAPSATRAARRRGAPRAD